MPVTNIQRPAQAPGCISLSQVSISVNTQQQCAWPSAPLHNSQAGHCAFTEHDTSMEWASHDDRTQPAADQAESVSAVPRTDNALHLSHYLAGRAQPVGTPHTPRHYSVNSGDISVSTASASMQPVYDQYNLYAAPSWLYHQQDSVAQQTQSLLPPLITKDGAHADTVRKLSPHKALSAGYNRGNMPMCSASHECRTEALQEPTNISTSDHLVDAHGTYTQHDALQTPQPTLATQSRQLWSVNNEGKDNATVPDIHQATFPSSAPVPLHAAATSTAHQYTSREITRDPSPAAAPAAAMEGASADTIATPTTIKASLIGLATSSQACCGAQQHLKGSSGSPAKPAEVTAGVHAWKRKKNVLEACLVYFALPVV